MKWIEFNDGDVISPTTEIEKLKIGKVDEREIYRFVIIDNKLYSFPDMFPYFTDELYDDLEFDKLYSVKFD